MAKDKGPVINEVKLQIQAGQASPAPPVGTALGPHGINMMDFCKAFNDKTKAKQGSLIPVVVSIYKDRSFTFIVKEPPMSALIKNKISLKKGSSVPNRDKVGHLTDQDIIEIAQQKLVDLNAFDIEAGKQIVCGTARSMGVTTD